MTRNPGTWALLGKETGELLDTHDSGLSFEDLGAFKGRFPTFCEEILDLHLTPQQLEGAQALEDNRQVLITSGNGVGKDTLTAAWSLYEVYVMGALVLLSGPTDRQVTEVLMRREVGRMWRAAKGRLPGERFERAIRVPSREEGGLLAFTASDSERFVGHHSALGRVFIGLTEAQGIPTEIFRAAQRCQPTRLLCVANPVSPVCAIYGFTKSAMWKSLRWSCLDHPNVVEVRQVVPGAVSAEWVQSMRLEHSEASRFWKVSVEGRFPEESEAPLFPASAWDTAIENGWDEQRRVWQDRTPAILGVDVARSGEDYTTVCVRRGQLLQALYRWREPDTMKNVERIIRVVVELYGKDGDPHWKRIGVETIVVDETSVGGGVFDRLRQIMASEQVRKWTRTRVVGFKSSRQAPSIERFQNTRAQSFFHLGEEFSEGRVAIAPEGIDEELLRLLREELLVHEVQYQSDDRVLIGSKDEIKRTLGRSPDLADSYAMSFLPDLKSSKKKKRVRIATYRRPYGYRRLG